MCSKYPRTTVVAVISQTAEASVGRLSALSAYPLTRGVLHSSLSAAFQDELMFKSHEPMSFYQNVDAGNGQCLRVEAFGGQVFGQRVASGRCFSPVY